jgi:hypothetical protein
MDTPITFEKLKSMYTDMRKIEDKYICHLLDQICADLDKPDLEKIDLFARRVNHVKTKKDNLLEYYFADNEPRTPPNSPMKLLDLNSNDESE